MLNEIKSYFVLKKILSNLGLLRKLYLFQYNKRIQKILNINILDYQLLSKVYKIEGKNVMGEEYTISNNKLSFKGEYKNGKKNGIGTSYYYNIGNISFEGNYQDGKKNGKGIEYDANGNIIFEGDYLNGYMYNGKGYDDNNNLVYELKDGCGYVKLYSSGKLSFEGEYLNGKKKRKRKKI